MEQTKVPQKCSLCRTDISESQELSSSNISETTPIDSLPSSNDSVRDSGDDLADEFVLIDKDLRACVVSGNWKRNYYEKHLYSKRVREQCHSKEMRNLCLICLKLLEKEVDKNTEEISIELKKYQKANSVLGSDAKLLPEPSTFVPDIERLSQEAQLYTEMKELLSQQQLLKEEMKKVEEERKQVETAELDYWTQYNLYMRDFVTFEREKQGLQYRIKLDSDLLAKLKSTNVYQDTFRIELGDYFGSIDSFRLGKLKKGDEPPWSEVNNGWGQAALLLCQIYQLLKESSFKLAHYRIMPIGTFSYMVSIDGPKPEFLPLHFNGESSVAKGLLYATGLGFLSGSGFDTAMIYYLDCLKQIGEFVEKKKYTLELPYKIDNDKLKSKTGESYSIKFHSTTYETWTKALKSMLTNLKVLLTLFGNK